MCGCTLKPISASSPARASSLAKPDGVNGLPRSEAKTKGEADWRLSSLSARNSSPRRGSAASCPPLKGERGDFYGPPLAPVAKVRLFPRRGGIEQHPAGVYQALAIQYHVLASRYRGAETSTCAGGVSHGAGFVIANPRHRHKGRQQKECN
jgi:hypothetical protein